MSAGRLAGFPNSLRLLTNLKNKKILALGSQGFVFIYLGFLVGFWLYLYDGNSQSTNSKTRNN